MGAGYNRGVVASGSGGPGCLDDATVVAFLEGALSSEARAAVDAHVDACAACLALVAAMGRAERSEPRDERDDTAGGPAPPGLVLGPGAEVGRYEIVRWLGRGGMSTVYAARDPELGREVALKLLQGGGRDEQSRLLREAQAMAQLAHPNVAAIHDVGRLDGQVFIALELIDGPTLGEWTEEERTLLELLEVFMQAGRGLVAAHEAGIVHRDFKPENVMIGADGRVRVLDFGLASARAGSGPLVPDDRATWATTLTVDGAFVGTPSYMSPEQYRSEPADERSDQFSFCVALHEALYGGRPFVGRSFDELSDAVRSGRVQEPESGPRLRVPAGIRRVIRRGLSVDRGARWSSMTELLEALDRAAGRRRWVWVAGGAILASAGLGGWAWQDRDARMGACADEGETMPAAWRQQRADVEAALGESGEVVLTRLDGYAHAWSEARTQQCEAARVHQTLPEPMWDRMATCFDDRHRSFDAVVSVLRYADAQVSARALQVVSGLDAIDACMDETGLMRQLDLPDDPELREEVNELRSELAAANPLAAAGRFEQGVELSTSVLQRAESLGYAPLIVEAKYWKGAFAARGEDRGVDLTLLEDAAELAGQIGHDEFAARAAMELLFAHTERSEFEVAEVWGRFARMGLARLDEAQAPELAVFVHTRLAYLARARGDYAAADRELELAHARATALGKPRPLGIVLGAQAEVALERSENAEARDLLIRGRALILEEIGEDNPESVVVGETLALVHMRLEEFDAAEALLMDAMRIHQATTGTEHPLYARALNNLGSLRLQQRRWADARTLLEEASAISERVSGADSTDTADFREGLALALINLGEYEEALRINRFVLRAFTKNLGAQHPYVAEAHTALGLVLRRLDRNDEAREHYVRALEILDVALPEGDRRTGNVLNNLGVLVTLEGDVEAAERYHRRALEIRERIYPNQHVMVVVSRLRLGEALCELERCDEGLPMLERGVEAEIATLPSGIRATGLFALARAVVATDPERALGLGEQAKLLDPTLAESVDAWVEERR